MHVISGHGQYGVKSLTGLFNRRARLLLKEQRVLARLDLLLPCLDLGPSRTAQAFHHAVRQRLCLLRDGSRRDIWELVSVNGIALPTFDGGVMLPLVLFALFEDRQLGYFSGGRRVWVR